MQHTASNGVDIAFVSEGSGPPIVLVHGFASNHVVNWRSTSWIKRLSERGRRVIALDCRGHGQSAKLYDPAQYHPKLMANDIFAVMDAAGIEEADLFGFSMGARISVTALLAEPGRIRSAVLGGVGETLLSPPNPEPVARALEADELPLDTPPGAAGFRAFATRTKSDLKALAACMRGVRLGFETEELAGIKTPTLVAGGDNDEIAGDPGPLVRAIPNAQELLIPNADHMTVIVNPAYVGGIIRFLDQGGLDQGGFDQSGAGP